MFNFLKSSFSKVQSALSRTQSFLGSRLKELFKGKVDEETLDKLEELFYQADLGVATAAELTQKVRILLQKESSLGWEGALKEIEKDLLAILNRHPSDLVEQKGEPTVILVVGVNGSGKTTSLAKLAALFRSAGKKVVIGAADTFRAAAIDQLEVWAQRVGADLIKHQPGSDPSAVAFDTIASQARQEALTSC